MHSLLNRTDAVTLGLLLFFGMIAMVVIGRWCSRKWDRDNKEVKGGVGSLLAALFALAGLILAFTFGMSGTRLEKIRTIVEQEANDIGTAILRADLYPDSVREGFRADFKDYVDAVIRFYENASNQPLVYKAKEDAGKAGEKLWARAARQARYADMFISSNQMVPALNRMLDTAVSREIILKSKVPDLIIYMLFICVLATCFIGGFTSEAIHVKGWIIVVGFAVISSLVVYTTIDLARPMRGAIIESAGQEAIIELRKMF